MRNSLKWLSPVMSLALLMGVSGVLHADDVPKTAVGTITGTVVDQDKKPAGNVTVNLWPAQPKKAAGPKTAIGDRTLGKKGNGEKPAKGDKPVAVATATTAGDGTFTMPNVPVGQYMIDAGSRKDATGYGKSNVTVAEGANATVTITMAPPKPKKAN